MSQQEILKSIEDLLNEEKWSKFQLSEYNVKKFKTIDKTLSKVKGDDLVDSVIKISKEYLDKNELNIVAKYMLSVLSFDKDKELFYSGFEKIIDNFKEREKWGIVEHLCRKMLDLEENEFGLKCLIESLRFLNKSSEIIEIQKKLLKLNPEDASTCLSIAKFNEQEKNNKEAIHYYKQAIRVFINQKNTKMVEDIWLKLVEMVEAKEANFFLEMENPLKSNFSAEFISTLFSILLPKLVKIKEYDFSIDILKKMLDYSPKNREYRDKLIEVYSAKYKGHSQLEELLKSSGLKMWWKDVNQAVSLFDKQIKFDVGVFVDHHSWGTGKIINITKDQIEVDFPENPEHRMSFDMALNTLQILAPDHVKVKKRYEPDKIKEIALKKPVTFIEMTVKSTPELEISLDDLKDDIAKGIIPSKDWMKWWNKAKKELKTTSNFKFIDAEKKIKYIESESSFGEIILNNFNKSEDFFEKIKIAYELIENDIHRKVDLKLYQQIADWFIQTLNTNLKAQPELSYISLIVIHKLGQAYSKISTKKLNVSAQDIINSASSIPDLFKRIDIVEYQKILIQDIVKYRDDFNDILYKIMLTESSKMFDTILDVFIHKGKQDIIEKIINEAIDNYRNYPELFLWVAKSTLTDEWKDKLKEKMDEYKFKIYESTFFLLSFLGRQIKNKANAENNTKLQKQIIRLLFDKNTNLYLNYIKDCANNNKDVSSILQLFRENEYIPTKHRENIIGELRSIEKPIIA
ncbi:MAG: hypothetical protein JW827_04690 [Spirochaetes bacterium]|nr:hypothetical protein [Spirochaetota bacterium]